MTNINKEITLQVGDQCRVLEDNPYDADIFEGDVVTVSSVTGVDISVLDDRNIEWHLDESKVEPIGTSVLDNKHRVIELPENFEITDKKGNKFIAKREQDPKTFPGIIDVEDKFADGAKHFALPYDELSKGSQYVIAKHTEKPTIEVDLGEAADDVISDLDEHLSESVDDFYLNDADKVIEESKERDFDEYYGEAESLKSERVYLAGPISTEGDVMYMSYLAEELRNLGYHVHAPHEDDSINDKTNDPSADDIFANDTDAIDISDIVVLVESGREQVGTHMEAGKIIERIEQGAPLELVVFTSNYRVEDTQIEDGKASASVNHYALGGYKRAGTWVDGMSAGMLKYMEERAETRQRRELFKSLPSSKKALHKGDVLVDRHSGEQYIVKDYKENEFGIIDVVLGDPLTEQETIDPLSVLHLFYVKKTEDGLIIDLDSDEAYYEEYDCEEEFQNLIDEEFGIFVGDTLIAKDDGMKVRVTELHDHMLNFEVLNTVWEGETWMGTYDEISYEYVKQLEDGRLINYSAEIVYKDNEHAKEDGIHVE